MKSLLKLCTVGLVLFFMNIQAVKSDCEIPEVPPLPAMDCQQIWCGATWSYSGCGTGNGNTCNEEDACDEGQDDFKQGS